MFSDFTQQQEVACMKWLARSPDFAPIDHLLGVARFRPALPCVCMIRCLFHNRSDPRNQNALNILPLTDVTDGVSIHIQSVLEVTSAQMFASEF